MGGESYDYESFKDLCTMYPKLEAMVSEYNEDGVIINASDEEIDDSEQDDSEPQDKEKKNISTAAKRAASKSLKKSL